MRLQTMIRQQGVQETLRQISGIEPASDFAQQVIARFGATVRDEVELEKLTGELLNVVSETMQPTSVRLARKAVRAGRYCAGG